VSSVVAAQARGDSLAVSLQRVGGQTHVAHQRFAQGQQLAQQFFRLFGLRMHHAGQHRLQVVLVGLGQPAGGQIQAGHGQAHLVPTLPIPFAVRAFSEAAEVGRLELQQLRLRGVIGPVGLAGGLSQKRVGSGLKHVGAALLQLLMQTLQDAQVGCSQGLQGRVLWTSDVCHGEGQP
jgi:hypothetical protein